MHIRPTVKNISNSSHSAQSNNPAQHKHAASSIQHTDRAPPGTTTPGQSGAGSNSNQEALCTPKSLSTTGTPPSDHPVSHPGHPRRVIPPLCRSTAGALYSPSRQGNQCQGYLENKSVPKNSLDLSFCIRFSPTE